MTDSSTQDGPRSRPKGQRILLVEDDDDQLDAIATILAGAGYHVDSCHDGREALERLSADPADVILLDLKMPVMDGWEFRVAQRADESIANVPVIVITSDTSPQATAIHADAYVQKPFRAAELLRQVERVSIEHTRWEQAAKSERSERLALLGTVAAGVGHEINNPLAFAMGNLELIDEALPALREDLACLAASTAPGQKELLARVIQGMDQLHGLVHDSHSGMDRVRLIVRNLRSLASRVDDMRELVDLRELLESSISMASTQLKYRSTLVRSFADVPRVLANEGRLCQVFLNLLVNAAQSMSAEPVASSQISVTTRKEDPWVVVEIGDTGPGMSKTLQSRIFEPFFTTRGTGGGTGLGLSICRDIVEAHGGHIDAESTLGHGSLFRVYLPQSEERQRRVSEITLARPITPVVATPAQLGRPSVWVLDDEPILGRLLGRTLSGSFNVFIATSAKEVFLRLEAGETFDALFCDLMMPDVTGMQVWARIAADWPALLPRMIFMSGGPSTAEGIAFVSHPDRLILDKPFSAQQVRSMLDASLKLQGSPMPPDVGSTNARHGS